jgi:carbon monoxide dehydrogenase subunit G
MSVAAEQEQADELPERWSAKANSGMVLRLLLGEAVDDVSRKIQVGPMSFLPNREHHFFTSRKRRHQ